MMTLPAWPDCGASVIALVSDGAAVLSDGAASLCKNTRGRGGYDPGRGLPT